jgi:hypothetical protein
MRRTAGRVFTFLQADRRSALLSAPSAPGGSGLAIQHWGLTNHCSGGTATWPSDLDASTDGPIGVPGTLVLPRQPGAVLVARRAWDSSEGGYEAKAVGHSVFTEAETFGEPKRKIQDAGRCHFEPAETTTWSFLLPPVELTGHRGAPPDCVPLLCPFCARGIDSRCARRRGTGHSASSCATFNAP